MDVAHEFQDLLGFKSAKISEVRKIIGQNPPGHTVSSNNENMPQLNNRVLAIQSNFLGKGVKCFTK